MSKHSPPLLWGANCRKAKFPERFVVQTIARKHQNKPLREFPERFVVQGTSPSTYSFRELEKSGKTGARADSLNDSLFRGLL